MPKVKSNITRFRKNLVQFLDLKQSGKLNGKAAVVEEKLRSAAEVVELDFDEEIGKIKEPNRVCVIGPGNGLMKEDIESLCYGLEQLGDIPDEELRENKAPKPEELYQTITDQIVELIQSGKDLPWQMPWNSNASYPDTWPTNFESKNPYRGINAILLAFTKIVKDDEGNKVRVTPGFNNPYYLTFKQIEKNGGRLKDGAVGQQAFYYNQIYSFDQESPKLNYSTLDREKFIEWLGQNRTDIPLLNSFSPSQLADQSTIPLLRYYNIYNGEDIEGIDFGKLEKPDPLSEDERLEIAEKIFEFYPNSPQLKIEGNKAAYYPKEDVIRMPSFSSFRSGQAYYSTLYHEAAHSTGHSSRLNRGNDSRKRDGSDEDKKAYGFEELVAEISAAFLCAEAGILFRTIDNSAAYLKAYKNALLELMKDDNKFFFRASSRAQASTDYILDRDDEGVPAYMSGVDLKGSEIGPPPKFDQLDLFDDEVRQNFTVHLEPRKETKATNRFEREGTDFEKAVVHAMVNNKDYKKLVQKLPEEKRKGFYQNLSWRLSQFPGPNNEPLWYQYINKSLNEFAEAIKREAKKMYKENNLRKNHHPNRTDIRLVKPKYQFKTEKEAWRSVAEATGLAPNQVKASHSAKCFRWEKADNTRENPGARFVMLGVCKEIIIDQVEYGYKTLNCVMAMFTNKKKDKLFLAPFSVLKEAPDSVKDKKAEEVFKEWHNYPADNKNFTLGWPDKKQEPVGFAHSILYASDKVLREWDHKGKLNLYEHDFDPGKRQAFIKGNILIISKLKIDERGILN